MTLFLISQTENDNYDTYDSAVVCAASADMARAIHPDGKTPPHEGRGVGTWAHSLGAVTVTAIGVASDDIKAGVVCASFNAG